MFEQSQLPCRKAENSVYGFANDTVQDKYGPDAFGDEDEDSESSTDYSSEDSEAEFVTPQVDAAILKMITKIRKGEDNIYSGNTDFFAGAFHL